MEFPLCDFNLRDLLRELHGYGLTTEGTQQELTDRLMTARHEKAEAQAQGFVRPGRAPITKYEACVQPDDFAQIAAMTDEEYAVFSKKVQWRLRRILKTYNRDGLEYYNPGVLHRIDRSKTYVLNMSEFWVRRSPYNHKIFVVFVSRTNGEEQRLCYARSLAVVRRPNTDLDQVKAPIITNDAIGRIITNIMLEIEDNGLENYVAIITPKNNVSMKALKEISIMCGQKLPQVVLDECHLQNSFLKMFCAKSARCLSQVKLELFEERTHLDQLRKLQKNYTQNVDAAALFKEYLIALPKVLQAMWKIEEHKNKPISLGSLNNERLSAYSAQVQNDLPPITFEECDSGGGLLQLILFDALWCLYEGHEMEEN
ncbi:uncharacterized protein LOC117784415 isoform X2 [Drosophila innubila]|uniref:uncharacterized protein LOC117784415 isoform X2 n=1 Tax=Drosophila innubila TaxID=198719 RepID=UPI00148C8EB5|nr:uncharacterized protein LOC117784415 isoform X2 [Drosophila innubila]